ncbi:MAG: hypothetical protein ABIR46_01135 [Candidatus Saccharimonadales bacterium]
MSVRLLSREMKKLATTTTLFTLALALVATTIMAPVSAVTTTQPRPNPSEAGQALEIAPPVLTLSGDPGQTIKSKISIRDVSTNKLIVQGEVNDFVANGEDGTPKILLEDGETSPYSMKTWVDPLSVLNLNPKQIQDLPITIRIPADAAPGGYFSVVRFTATAPELDGTGVSLSASLGALVFMRVNGAAKESMTLEEFKVTTDKGLIKKVFESTPLTFVQRIKNTGNVHMQPAGQVTITDMFGKKIAAVNVNLPPRNILPGSIRRFEQKLDKSVIGNAVLFGRYTANLKVTYGDSKHVLTSKISFWVIPYKLIGFGILGLIVAFFVLRNMIRRYNQSIIKRAQKSTRKK